MENDKCYDDIVKEVLTLHKIKPVNVILFAKNLNHEHSNVGYMMINKKIQHQIDEEWKKECEKFNVKLYYIMF